MSLIDLHVGPFAAVYVGLASGLDSAQLIQLTGLTTGEQRVTASIPETFNYSAQNSLQSGPIEVTASLTFLSDDPQAWRLSYGNFLDAAWQDSTSQFVKLALLLIHPDSTAESSFLIPTCYARKTVSMNAAKSTPTILPIQFGWQDLSIHNGIYYKRTPDELATILGARSPL